LRRPDIHIKSSPDAWRVHEVLDLPFAGSGEHVYFHVEKQNLNTLDVARRLAGACNVGVQQVGYAGLKDKHGVTRQWFSVPSASDCWPLGGSSDRDGGAEASAFLRCLQVARHTHKLRHGDHRCNQFILRLVGDEDFDGASLAALEDWFPNYFGPQRVSPDNVSAARYWLAQGPKKAPRRRGSAAPRGGRRGWHLSVLRSELFNAVLDRRVALGNYAEVIDGDVVADGVPTGPLWGRGRSPAAAAAAEIEQQALLPHKQVSEALEFTGVQQGRRPLAQRPGGFSVDVQARGAEVAFELPPGAYATTLLAHHFNVHDDSKQI